MDAESFACSALILNANVYGPGLFNGGSIVSLIGREGLLGGIKG